MRRSFLLILIALLLTACGGATEAPAAVEQAVEAPKADAVTAPDGDEQEGETAVDPDNPDTDFTPATTVAEAADARLRDWTKGAPDAAVTIIEYGDFQ